MKYIACFFCSFILFHHAPAQNTFTSPYSIYGLGLMNDRSTSLSRSLSGTGIAIQSTDNLNVVNPASYSSIASPLSHIFETGFYVEKNRYSTESQSESKNNGGLSNMNFWFKFKPWWSSMFGISPYSSVSYNIISQKDLGSGATGNYTYKGSGNIDQLYWGNSVTVFKKLSLGVHTSFIFGSIHRSETLQSATIPSPLTVDHKIFTNKFHLDFGAQYRFAFKKRSLVIGVTADNGTTFYGKTRIALFDANSDTLNSHGSTPLTYKIPLNAGFGLSLQSKRTIIAADVKYKQWSKASFPEVVTFNDTWRASAGMIYLGNPRATRLTQLISLRAGAYMENYYLKLKGLSTTTFGLSAGASFPMMDGKSSLNFTYSYDQFGTTQNGLIQQQSQKFMFDVIIRDWWGYRRKFD